MIVTFSVCPASQTLRRLATGSLNPWETTADCGKSKQSALPLNSDAVLGGHVAPFTPPFVNTYSGPQTLREFENH